MLSNPVRGWALGVGVWGLISGSIFLVNQVENGSASRNFLSTFWLPGFFLVTNFVIWIYMDRLAKSSLEEMSHSGITETLDPDDLYTDFISVPERTTSMIFIIALIATLAILPVMRPLYDIKGVGTTILVSLFSWLGQGFEFLSIYRILRQLGRMRRNYSLIREINLFNLRPIYALTRYTYTLSFVFILIGAALSAVLMRNPEEVSFGLYILGYNLFFVLLIFFTPLLEINRRLRAEKADILQRQGTEMKVLFDETEKAVAARDVTLIGNLQTASKALREQMEVVQKTATWPWRPGSIRNLLIPVLLPLTVGILQRYVLGLLGF